MPHVPLKRRLWAFTIPYGLAAVLALLAVVFWSESLTLRRTVASLERRYSEQQNRLSQAQDLVNTFTSAEAKHITLVAVKTLPQPQGKAFYLRSTGHLIFLASNMASLPATKAYELWLIPETGAPIPAGVFKPDAHGSATIVNPPLPRGVEAKAFAITIEPEAGSAAPTTQPIIVGAGE
jgi:anti-sigma-K factor RskA